jgi:hypothetical protein
MRFRKIDRATMAGPPEALFEGIRISGASATREVIGDRLGV